MQTCCDSGAPCSSRVFLKHRGESSASSEVFSKNLLEFIIMREKTLRMKMKTDCFVLANVHVVYFEQHTAASLWEPSRTVSHVDETFSTISLV